MATKPNTSAVKFSYFRLSLLSYLRDTHPTKATDLDFIAVRGDSAAETYSQAIKAGHTHDEAEAISSQVLYEGLYFSTYRTLVTILWEEFSEEVDPSQAEGIAMELLPRLTDTIQKYTLSDDFADTLQYNQFYTELTGEIQILLENGL
ncbi:DUF1896 family protein [uncultured Dysgonomonas sp.]|uniref:DUF1896 domain-containing protein n=1 Tax=uncultured Dysgonomonas sp. TaxID=206096 RepID=A0A212JNG6_9BACT|nr:DUF1896 family protein [uncultured Dysgonomonas sp.]SBW00979.1 conserved hypothetical protein [uncultured Dysgonomonas sp.]